MEAGGHCCNILGTDGEWNSCRCGGVGLKGTTSLTRDCGRISLGGMLRLEDVQHWMATLGAGIIREKHTTLITLS